MADASVPSNTPCGSCGLENPSTAKFCGNCGRALGLAPPCPECGAETLPAQRFCNECGAALTAGAPIAVPPQAREAAGDGERKQVTVVFADVTGSMELAEQTDPEQLREIMDGLFIELADAVVQYDGTVDKFTGDGLMALFGAPIAQEDHAQRACHAALAMLERVDDFAARLQNDQGIDLAVRVGVNSGEVIAGSIGAQGASEYTAVGHTVGMAQRMESLAEPGTACVAEVTARLVGDHFALTDLGEFAVKGSSAPQRVFRLDASGSGGGGGEPSACRDTARFVGRDDELAQLVSALDLALAGNGGVVGIVGEAGVGKSRLCRELIAICHERGVKVCNARCQAHARNVPLMPARQLMRSYFDVAPEDTDVVAREKISAGLLKVDPSLSGEISLVFEFLAITDAANPAPQMNPEAKRRRLYDLTRHVIQMSKEPVVNVIEDLHWMDPASEIFVSAFVDAVPGTQALLVTNFRPEYKGDWTDRAHYRQIPLAGLGADDVNGLLADALGDDPSLDGLAEMLYERTGGNPFFTEETVRELIESGALAGERGALRLARQIEELSVPASVQSVLAARIDRLTPEAKSLLAAASAIGGEFTGELLAQTVRFDETALDRLLNELIAGEFIDSIRLLPVPEYAFRHPLTREVAYGAQLAPARSRSHNEIARAIQDLYPDETNERAAMIAHHYEAAGNGRQAAEWHTRAATWAGFNDPHVALRGWKRVQALADALPPEDDPDPLRMAARSMLLRLGWRLGGSIEEATRWFEEAKEIAERLGDRAALSLIYGGYGATLGLSGGDAAAYAELCDESMRLGLEVDDPGFRAAITLAPIYAYFLTGRYGDAIAAADLTIELTESDPMLGSGIVVNCPRGLALAFRALPLSHVGRVEEARESLRAGIELSRKYDPESLCWSLGTTCSLVANHTLPVGQAAIERALETTALAASHGDTFSFTAAACWLGSVLAYDGRLAEAEAEFKKVMQMTVERRVGSEFKNFMHNNRGEALLWHGQIAGAIADAEAGLADATKGGLTTLLPSLKRTLADALLSRDQPGDFERGGELLGEAEAIARSMGARLDGVGLTLSRAKRARAQGDEAKFSELLEAAQDEATAIDARGYFDLIAKLRGTAVAPSS